MVHFESLSFSVTITAKDLSSAGRAFNNQPEGRDPVESVSSVWCSILIMHGPIHRRSYQQDRRPRMGGASSYHYLNNTDFIGDEKHLDKLILKTRE